MYSCVWVSFSVIKITKNDFIGAGSIMELDLMGGWPRNKVLSNSPIFFYWNDPDLVENLEDRFSHYLAHLSYNQSVVPNIVLYYS